MKTFLVILSFLFVRADHFPEQGIHFIIPQSLESLLEQAKTDKKLVFIDFYAEWCAPCKVLDQVFLEEDLSHYFNSNFINSKIDVESTLGQQISKDLNIVFLPSMIILDQHGEVLLKIENVVSAAQLLNAAKESILGTNALNAYALSNSPFPSKNKSGTFDYDPNDKERVIYVHDDRASSARPQIMFHEAYLHLQLMDGKHEKVVKKYLSTQSDWSTKKNIKFIFDFVSKVDSDLFQYFINNKDRFIAVLGAEKVNNTLEIIIHERLMRGFPRPDLNEAIALYSFINANNAKERAYEYFLNRSLEENNFPRYLELADTYLSVLNPFNEHVLLQYVSIGLSEPHTNEDLQSFISKLESAIAISEYNPNLYHKLAEVYFIKKDPLNALKNINIAIDFGSDNIDYNLMLELKDKIENL